MTDMRTKSLLLLIRSDFKMAFLFEEISDYIVDVELLGNE